jgi:hypothetical protein
VVGSVGASVSSQRGQAPAGVVSALQDAAQKTGVGFSYLLKKAGQESGYQATAKASSSSATGLFQFTEQTWLSMVQKHGAKYGLAAAADKISETDSGRLKVASSADRQAILDLRNDPRLSALMAGEYTRENQASLQKTVGGKIGDTELYLAHFLGAGGASKLLQAQRCNGAACAADLLPEAASANRSVFYDPQGNARSVQDVYKRFAGIFGGGSSGTVAATPTVSPVSAASAWGTMDFTSPSAAAGGGTVSSVVSSAQDWMGGQPQSLFATMMLAQMTLPNETDADTPKNRQNQQNAGQVLKAYY